MGRPPDSQALQANISNPFEEVVILADIVGKSETTLAAVMRDFTALVENPIIAGGFAMAHHGYVRATTDIDVIAVKSSKDLIKKFQSRGYKYEAIQLPIGSLELLTKGNKGIDFIGLNNTKLMRTIEARANEGTFFNKKARFVSLEDLMILKLLATLGRTKKQDEADLEVLTKLPHDKAYLDLWKKNLNVP
jgi:hypothetical protein